VRIESAAPVTLAVVGAGVRGNVYASFAGQYPERARVVAVVDPLAWRRDALADRYGAEHRFADWRELAARGRIADAVVIATPDREHAEPARRFARLGCAMLLEKPIAPDEADCVALIDDLEASGVLLAVCHVLRYTAYTDAVKGMVDAGRLGDIVGVQHLEPVGWWHYAHSFVRGNWRRTDETTFSLLAKCCHDLDWLRYITGRVPVTVSSTGGLHHFRPDNRPARAADRCLDCAVEPDCPYSAPRLYLGCLEDPRRERWPLSVLTSDLTEAGVLRALRDGPYGRCVYACDNDVADHQVVTIDFDGGVRATLTMSAFTPFAQRRTQIMGTRGFLDGDGDRIRVSDFVSGRTEITALPATSDGHGGGDFGLMDAFVSAVATGEPTLIRSGARESLDSHRMAFAAERSRLAGGRPVPLEDLARPAS
jgi:predicted dehydrogenase